MTLEEYLAAFGTKITQPSERLFLEEFLHPLLGSRIEDVLPQVLFVDSTGRARRIDFAYNGPAAKIALEVNGESYHAEGVIPNEQFDDNLFRQNEILRRGYVLARFSYSQLQSPKWRPLVADTLRALFEEHAPELLQPRTLTPTSVQTEALQALAHARDVRGWASGVVVMPTGTGKTVMSALDARRVGGRTLFVVHRLDILAQSVEAYGKVWPDASPGILTGDERTNIEDCDILFASKDTLRQPAELERFAPDAFAYVIVDEVHHGQTPSYSSIFDHFRPRFMLGMTATPDRTDRRDIFELFDYQKVYEISLGEVIERGLLVPYSYVGLTDDIDYSTIRYQQHRYRVDDLERLLIIPERNRAILDAYQDPALGAGDKALGFCVSIAHAERMSEYFNANGVKAAAIHSQSPDRHGLIEAFRANDLQIAFTVDLFNEGMDFPNLRVLLFLRPTESKTVFLQQLGRGLRLLPGKERVRILDFIGNYQRANQIRKYLAKQVTRQDEVDEHGRRKKKLVYEYSTGCEVRFDQRVEELLDQQDADELGVDKVDLTEAYFALSEDLRRKPTKTELDERGEYPARLYIQAWGTWRAFLQDIGEYTEASYHYPQGTHLGHVLSILWYFGLPSRTDTHLDDRFIRMRGDLGEGRIAGYRRQLKYKLQAAMELGLLEDDRRIPTDEQRSPSLTSLGREARAALATQLQDAPLAFPADEEGIPSSRMEEDPSYYNRLIKEAVETSEEAARILLPIFLQMPAVSQMNAYLFQVVRADEVEKNKIYGEFFGTPLVERFCEREGIDPATTEASRRRCPFLLNVLEACGVLDQATSKVTLRRLILTPEMVRSTDGEDPQEITERLHAVAQALADEEPLEEHVDTILKELYGPQFLTDEYFMNDIRTLPT